MNLNVKNIHLFLTGSVFVTGGFRLSGVPDPPANYVSVRCVSRGLCVCARWKNADVSHVTTNRTPHGKMPSGFPRSCTSSNAGKQRSPGKVVSISQPGEGARKPASAPRKKGFSLTEAGAGERPGGAVERCWSGFSQGAEKL